MPDASLSLFISYSRTDSALVDRIEADLKARNFYVWVDRRKIEAGQNFRDELQKAIDRCQIVLVVLSPEAMASKYVRQEYGYADEQNKTIIPLNWRATKVPLTLNGIQWVDFQGNYDQGLADLLIFLSRQEIAALPPAKPHPSTSINISEPEPLVQPQPAAALPDADLNELYRAGVAARAQGDLERTAIFWKQVLDRNPSFGNGTLTPQMQRLMAELHPIRVQRLREQAEQAHRSGAWGQEIGAWQALSGLEPEDKQAKERLPVAQQNQQYAWMYENAQEFAKAKNIPALKEQVGLLWQHAPYYGDPAGLAKLVELKAPPSFQEASNAQSRAQTALAETKRKEEKALDQKYQGQAFLDHIYWRWNTLAATRVAFCLLAGVGVSIGALSQSWYWAGGITLILALLAYGLGYRRVVGLTEAAIIILASIVIVFGITWFLSTFHYAQPQVSHLWFGTRTVTLRSQVIFGTILGAIGGIVQGFFVQEDVEVLPAPLIGVLIIWSIIALLGSLFDWGFGFGFGWSFTWLAGILPAFVGGISLVLAVNISSKSFEWPSDDSYIKAEIERLKEDDLIKGEI
ncbi:MAG TPA: toll/interleukin-1 receptor domain-containing protein [Ktedonobacterales bacterium]|nr:toll/interleukin-1 receptor domain-containing protein [Ktedonobacterales bacterium]